MSHCRSSSRCPPAFRPPLRTGCAITRNLLRVALTLSLWLTAAPVFGSPEGPSRSWWPSLGLAATPPHPAVVRITAAERNSLAQGSGSLVAVSERHGLVITNWHVVRDAAGPIAVIFPDGFQSAAQVLKLDSDWDLAALLIWRPHASPIPLANVPPKPGDTLTIAGYGSGNYRAVSGRCTQYVAPGIHMPYEMVELSAAARQGDSGGPILNDRGELAGVLFGSSGGTTSGSYCGRVRAFLASLWPDLAAGASPSPELTPPPSQTSAQLNLPPPPATFAENPRPQEPPPEITSFPTSLPTAGTLPSYPDTSLHDWASFPELMSKPGTPDEWLRLAGATPVEQAKTILAGIGLLAVLVQFARWLSQETKSEAK